MVGEGQKNEFGGGMNQDLSKTKIPANMYYQAQNFRISTDKGLSDTSLENVKGNLQLLTIPDLPTVQKISIDTSILGIVNIQISDGTFTDVGTVPFTISAGTTPEDFYNYIQNNTGYANVNSLYFVYYNESYLLFNPSTDATTYTITITGPASAGIIIDNNFIPAQTNLEVIGSTHINDDIYILTTNNTTQEPGETDPVSYGQIFKIVIDNANNTATITNIYNNKVNFSTYNAIPPSAIEGRYENGSIQRIYWTDNYNKLRTINVVNPQVFAIDITLLDIVPAVDFDIPIMTDIRSAAGTHTIDVGAYQLAYRLKNTTGSETSFSPPSNIVYVTDVAEETEVGGANWARYVGSIGGSTTTKQIKWIVNNVDVDFERIEFIVLIRKTRDEIPTIYSVGEFPINDQESITFIFNGDILNSDDTTTVSLEDFLKLSGLFTHCKTIATKDNRLVVGNVRIKKAVLDYDARAFRAATAGVDDVFLTNNGSADPSITQAAASALPETSDTINDYSSLLHRGYYKPGTSILGGAGTNISYEFITVATSVDKDIQIADFSPFPFTATNPDFSTDRISLDVYSGNFKQEYNTSFNGPINAGIKFPPYNSVLIGYQATEIYRFGIQFYNKAKDPFFVKWIGDIKFPDYGETLPAANCLYENMIDLTGQTVYRKIFQNGSKTYNNQLGIKFTVNIPAEISEQVSGYSIVRVKRKETDKSIIAEGIVTCEAAVDSSNGEYYLGSESESFLNGSRGLAPFVFFSSPNLLDPSLTSPSIGMTIRPKFELTYINNTSTNICPDTTCTFGNFNMYKLFAEAGLPVTYVPETITEFTVIGGYTTANMGGGFSIIHNWQYHTITFDQMGGGSTNYLFTLSNPLPLTFNTKIFCLITRVPTNQYGGQTYSARATNEYIMCSHFKPIRTSVTATSETFYLMGGDVTSGIMDDQRVYKNLVSPSPDPRSTTFFYPASSSVNIGLRTGQHVNRFFNQSGPIDDYQYNNVYSAENDIVKFFPKPDPFIETDIFVNRFHISEIKINGELLDSWAIYKPLNYWDVEGSYGAINGIIILQDEAYFIQDKAFGKLLINPKTAITSADGETIQLGRGNIIDSHDYVSVEIGSTHQFSFLKSGYKIYFVDTRHKKIYGFSQNRPLTPDSDIKGMHSWLINNVYGLLETTDKPVFLDSVGSTPTGTNGIHGVFDYINDELIYTFFRGKNVGEGQALTIPTTLVYNEKLDKFTGFYTHYPKQYITNNRRFLSADPANKQSLYMHNYGNYGNFYNFNYESFIEFISNAKPEFTKTFNNLQIQTEIQDGTTLVDIDSGATPIHESFNSIEVSNDHQSSGNVILTAMSNIVRFFRSWRTQVPRNSTQSAYTSPGLFARMTDKYLRIKLLYQNKSNRRLLVHNIISFFKTHSPN